MTNEVELRALDAGARRRDEEEEEDEPLASLWPSVSPPTGCGTKIELCVIGKCTFCPRFFTRPAQSAAALVGSYSTSS